MIVTIDGPAASGKSTMAQRVAEMSGFVFMDSGIMYRAVAFGFLKHGVALNEKEILAYLSMIRLEVSCIQASMKVHIDGKDITAKLHTSRVSEVSSRIAVFGGVREWLLGVQRGFGDQYGTAPGVIAVGRDMGTVVFPRAELKFFVTAPLAVRASRRNAELLQAGGSLSLEEVRNAIKERDDQDSRRKVAPLKKALDAITIDTGNLTPESQAEIVLRYIWERR